MEQNVRWLQTFKSQAYNTYEAVHVIIIHYSECFQNLKIAMSQKFQSLESKKHEKYF